MRAIFAPLCFLAASFVPRAALAVKSGELYTEASYTYGRFEASIEFAPGDGIVGAFFLWKAGSEVEGTFWNELDFEKVGAACQLESNAYYGNPAVVHAQRHTPAMLLCGTMHTYAFEWTPTYIAWLVDGVELRRETGEAATAYAENATEGMQYRFNIWPGDASFGGNFDPASLPVYQRIDWVQYSSFENGTFTVEWRDDFNGTALDARWLLGTWDSPKGLSQHDERNVGIVDGKAIIALTTDEGVGEGVPPPMGAGGMGGAAGAAGMGGASAGGAAGNAGGSVSGGNAGSNAGGAMSGGASGASGSSAGGSDSGGASLGGASSAGSAGDAGAAVAGAGAGGVSGSSAVVSGGSSGSGASGAPGSGGSAGSLPGVAGDSSSGGTNGHPPAPPSDSGCTLSPSRSHGTSGSLVALTLALLGALGVRRSRRVRA
jgi:endo-1,3-1,4-beta-glycanase ExoK